MKKTFIIIFAIFVCILSGCANQQSDKVVVKFSAWGSQSETAVLKPILKDFEMENPDIRVEFLHVPQNYFQKIHLMFASRLAPDVVFMNNFYSQKYIKANLLTDLTPYFQKELSDKIFFDKAVESSSYNEKLYVVPRDVSDLVVFYNKDIFRKNNVPFPDESWTINDYIKTAQKLTSKEVWGTGFEREPLYWLPFLFSNCSGILSDDGQKVIVNSPASQKALSEYADIVNKYHAAPAKSESASLTMAQLFIQGRLAMQISGRWLVPKYRSNVNFDWDIVQFPKGSCGSVTGVDSSGYAVAASSKHKDEAVRLIKYLSSQDSMRKLAQSGLIVPARKDAAYSNDFLAPDKKPKNAAAFLDAVQSGKVTPVNENYQELTDRLNKELEPMFEGRQSLQSP